MAYTAAHKNWNVGDLAGIARNLVTIEERDRPDTVGGPISILSVDWIGRTEWVDHGSCFDAQAPQRPQSKAKAKK